MFQANREQASGCPDQQERGHAGVPGKEWITGSGMIEDNRASIAAQVRGIITAF